MVELATALDFGLKAAAEAFVIGPEGEHFDRGGLAGLEVDALVDGSHAAPAQLPHHTVWPKLLDLHPPPHLARQGPLYPGDEGLTTT